MTDKGDFGAELRQARERRGISLRQIATSTKISMSALEALERNDVSRLPGGIFTRAFVRSYAAEVGLDPEETVTRFLAQFASENISDGAAHAPEGQRHGVAEGSFESQQRMARAVLKLLLLSVPIAIALLYFTLRGPSTPPSVQGTVEPPTAGPAAGRGAEETNVARRPPPPSDVEPTLPAPEASLPAATPGPFTLEIAPVGACWVSLTVDGTLIVSRVLQPGERVARQVREVASIEIGDAGAFVYTINGRAGRSLGGPGQVRSARITTSNYPTFWREATESGSPDSRRGLDLAMSAP